MAPVLEPHTLHLLVRARTHYFGGHCTRDRYDRSGRVGRSENARAVAAAVWRRRGGFAGTARGQRQFHDHGGRSRFLDYHRRPLASVQPIHLPGPPQLYARPHQSNRARRVRRHFRIRPGGAPYHSRGRRRRVCSLVSHAIRLGLGVCRDRVSGLLYPPHRDIHSGLPDSRGGFRRNPQGSRPSVSRRGRKGGLRRRYVRTEPGETWYAVSAAPTGYIQEIDTAELLAFAGAHAMVIRMERAIGEFLIEGTPVVSALGTKPLDEKDVRRLASACTVGPQRTLDQDAAFGIRQLVDVAMKALSPGINDTTTAVMCVDYLTAILVRLADRQIESRYRAKDGELRLLTRGPTFKSLVGESYNQIRQNAGGNIAVLARLLRSLETLADRTSMAARRRVLLDQARALEELGHRSIPAPSDRQYIDSWSARLVAALDSSKHV